MSCNPAPASLRELVGMLSTRSSPAPDGTWDMPTANGPCRTWPLNPECGCALPDGPPWPEQFARCVETATEYLWRRTAGLYGVCWEQIRPCPAPPHEIAPRGGVSWPDPNGTAPPASSWGPGSGQAPVAHWRYWPGDSGGDFWENYGYGWYGTCGCGNSIGSCGCPPAAEIRLPGPVWQDLSPGCPHGDLYRVEVWINGWRQPFANYRLLDDGHLVSTCHPWPVWQDLTRPLQPHLEPLACQDECPPEVVENQCAGTWGIRYWRGNPVPTGGVDAVTELACELWRMCQGNECRLPRGVQNIMREGVSYTLIDQSEDWLAYLPHINAWINTVNPAGLKEQPYVVSIDMPRRRSESRLRPLWGPYWGHRR